MLENKNKKTTFTCFYHSMHNAAVCGEEIMKKNNYLLLALLENAGLVN